MKWSWTVTAAAGFAAAAVLSTSALSQQPQPKAGAAPVGPSRGETLFSERGKSCHEPALDRAPSRSALSAMWGADVVKALKTGAMQPMAAGLSDTDINQIATFVTGRAPDATFDLSKEAANPCPASNRFNPAGPAWNGWSPDKANTRTAAATSITAANAPRLKVKWSFAYQGGRYGQPTQFGNRVFVTSSSGRAYALDRATGCVAWSFDAKAGMRVTVSVGPLASAPSKYAAYFGDQGGNVYAVDAGSGRKLWDVRVEAHPRAILTGAPTLYQDTLYVPTSSLEEFTGSTLAYECCTFRGSVSALDTRTGRVKWKTYAIPAAPAAFKKNSAGTQMYGPAGAAIWNAPTIDPKRGVLYVSTGDSYTDIDEDYSDGLIAMDLTTGTIRWHRQMTKDDAFLVGCGRAGTANCPNAVGPDHDFGASIILMKMANGKDILVAGQKSGQVYGVDPDKDGAIIWQTRIGMGSALGGVEWGMAADRTNVYVAVNQGAEQAGQTPGGAGRSLTALRLADGIKVWQHLAPGGPGVCNYAPNCRAPGGYSGPPSLANNVLYGVNQDGHVRAFTVSDGKLIWDFDTGAQKYDTVNGVKNQRGGNLDATGITFAGDMAFLMAGFNSFSGSSGPDNVLLAFTVDGK